MGAGFLYCSLSTIFAQDQSIMKTQLLTSLPIRFFTAVVLVTTSLANANTVVTPSKDTYINSAATTTNYGTATTMVSNNNGTFRYALFSFDISSVTETVTSAKLELQDNAGNAGSKSYEIYGLLDTEDGWDESTLNWSNASFLNGTSVDLAKTYGGAKLGDFNTAPNTNFTAFDVSSGSYIDFLNAGGNRIITYIIVDPLNDSSGSGWATKESSLLKPTLTISTTPILPDTTPPTLTDIVGNRSSGQIAIGTPVTYTITFSEPIASASITSTDFGNAGSAFFTMGNIVTISPNTFSLTLTPTSVGTLQPQILAGAGLTDLAGNPLDTTSAIVATTQIEVLESLPLRRIRVFLVGGQSNADGRAAVSGLPTSPVNLQQPQTDVDLYYKVENQTAALTTLRPGLSETGAFGPSITLGRRLADALADGTTSRIALIKYANGGTNLHTQWKAGGDATTTGDGSEYRVFQQTVTGGLAALAAAYPSAMIEIEGMLWVQGESDNSAVNAAAYQTNLTNFIADIRATYGASLRFVVSRLSIGQTGVGAELTTIRAAQTAVAAADPLIALLDTDVFGISGDNLHFNAAGYQQIGNSAADLLLHFRPFTTSPAIIPQSNGTLKISVPDVFPGFLYTLYSSGNLGPDSWEYEESITTVGTDLEFTVTPDPMELRRFYRVERTLVP